MTRVITSALCWVAVGCSTSAPPEQEARPGTLAPLPDVLTCVFDGQPEGVVQEIALAEPLAHPVLFNALTSIPDPTLPDVTLVLSDGAVFELHKGGDAPIEALRLPGGTVLAMDASPTHGDALFVALITDEDQLRVSRFVRGPDGFDPDSELALVTSNRARHAAVALAPDGLLFVAIGDSTEDATKSVDAQDASTLEGSVLRLDVTTLDDTGTYAVPDDNPTGGKFGLPVEGPVPTWATGVRLPIGCAVDELGELYCLEHGVSVSEIHRITEARDLGWPDFDGNRCLLPNGCELDLARFPAATLDAEKGCTWQGIQIGQNPEVPQLRDTLYFTESCSGQIHGLLLRSPDSWFWKAPVVVSSGITGLGRTAGGDVTALVDGQVSVIEPLHELGSFPSLLSETGCFDDLLSRHPAPGVIPYDVNAPLYSDGSEKARFFQVPLGEKISVVDGTWEFPVGSVLIKDFAYPVKNGKGAKPVETRVMIKRTFGWEFHTYAWREDGLDAVLAAKGSTVIVDGETDFEHLIPSRPTCITCHGTSSRLPLALRTDQLDRRVQYDNGTASQIDAMIAIGLLVDGSTDGVEPMPDPFGDAPVERRARAYLHTNCAHCHRPEGWVSANIDMDLRFETAFVDTKTCDAKTESGSSGTRLLPGEPDRSRLVERMNTRDPFQMPPFATSLVDEPGVSLIRAWIGAIEACPD